VSLDGSGEFDETWLCDAYVHIERMNETGFWIGIKTRTGVLVTINTGVHKGEWYFNVEEDGGKHYTVRRPRNSKRKLPEKFIETMAAASGMTVAEWVKRYNELTPEQIAAWREKQCK